MKKKQYTAPDMEIDLLEAYDVICASTGDGAGDHEQDYDDL